MAIEPLKDEKITVRNPDKKNETMSVSEVDSMFADNCPLWTYILAEAGEHATNELIPVLGGGSRKTPKLGPVGGRIVAEVFLGLMFGDGNSMLRRDPLWTPEKREKSPWTGKEPYKLRDLVEEGLKFQPRENSHECESS
jgi:hypothetical protein